MGVWMPQYSSESSSLMEMAVRSDRPRKAKRMPRKAMDAEGARNSRGVGYNMSISYRSKSQNVNGTYELH